MRATPRKNEKIALIAELLRSAGPAAELVALYLTGTLRQGRIGLGWRAIEDATNAVAEAAAGEPLTLGELDTTFEELGAISGPGSNARRREALRAVFVRASPAERRFLVELLLGEVRQGALDGIVVEALGKAAGLPLARVRGAAMFADNLGLLARVALEQGEAGLSRFSLKLLSPIAPMLASPAAGMAEVLERLGEALLEYKLDGARIQLHKRDDDVRVFTRQLQDVTERVPELVEWARARNESELLLDGEALALRPDGRPQPFQVTMRRFGRSKDVDNARDDLPLRPFFFDCLHTASDGTLLSAPLRERHEALSRVVPPEASVKSLITRETLRPPWHSSEAPSTLVTRA